MLGLNDSHATSKLLGRERRDSSKDRTNPRSFSQTGPLDQRLAPEAVESQLQR